MTDVPRPPTLDRVTIVPIVMAALLSGGAEPQGDPDEVGVAQIECERPGILAGLPVAKETFGRLGARCRGLADEGSEIEAGQSVAEMGGPLAAIRGASPTAVAFLTRLSAIASGALESVPGDPLDAYAAELRLSRRDPVGHDGPSDHARDRGPSFRLRI